MRPLYYPVSAGFLWAYRTIFQIRLHLSRRCSRFLEERWRTRWCCWHWYWWLIVLICVWSDRRHLYNSNLLCSSSNSRACSPRPPRLSTATILNSNRLLPIWNSGRISSTVPYALDSLSASLVSACIFSHLANFENVFSMLVISERRKCVCNSCIW